MAFGRTKPEQYPHILNPVAYRDYQSLYYSAAVAEGGVLKEGKQGGNFRLRTGLAVTVTIPPSLRAFRHPNLVRGWGSPVIDETEHKEINEFYRWYKVARSRATKVDKKIIQLQRYRKKVVQRLAQYRRNGDAAGVARMEARLQAVNARLIEIRQFSSEQVFDTYSAEFEISDFITAMSWSSTWENSFIQLDLNLDNSHGVFNFMPEGSKVTVWRRKSLKNDSGGINDLYGGGKWYRYFTTYIVSKNRSATSRNQTMDLVCTDRLDLSKSTHYTKKKKWTKDKSHPKGWTPREITMMVCDATGLPYNKADIPSSYIIRRAVRRANGKREIVNRRITIPRIEYDPGETSTHTLLSGAWNRALEKIPRNDRLPYSMHMRDGTLKIEFIAPPGDPEGQYQRPMFTDKDNIETITLEETMDSEEVYTEVKASGTIRTTKKDKKGKNRRGKKKVSGIFTPSGVRGEAVIKAYGRRRKDLKFDKMTFENKKEFENAAQRWIDDNSRAIRNISLEGRGPLGIWPQYFVNLQSRYVGIKGDVWVESMSYSVENGLITVSLELNAHQRQYRKGEEYYAKYPRVLRGDRWY